MISIELPDDIMSLLRGSGRPVEVVARELIIVGLYHRRALIGNRVTELLGADRLPEDWTRDDGGGTPESSPSLSVD